MVSTPLVSIVIPCYNAKKILKGCLTSVLKTKYPNFEVIVVDDRSRDSSYEYLIKNYSKNKKMRIVRNGKNFGPSVTRNNGIAQAKGKYIAFIETDMEVEPNWLLPLVQKLENDSNLGAVQSKTLDIKRRDLIHSMRARINPHTFWVISPECGLSSEWTPENLETSIGAVGSMVKTDIIRKIGGFDQMLVHNIDDIDLGWRIWLAGYKTLSVPQSITYHWTAKPFKTREQATPKFSSEFHFYKGHRLILKNYELKNVIRYLPWQIFAYLLNVSRNIFLGNFIPLAAYSKAILWNLANLGDTLRERKRIQNLRKRSDKEMFEKLGIHGNFFQFYFGIMIKNLLWVRKIFMNYKDEKIIRERCLICGFMLDVKRYKEVEVENNHFYLICPHCGGGNLMPRPSKKEITKAYEKKEYYEGLSKALKNPFIQWIITRRIHSTASEWVKQNFKRGKILDVGCGNGEFLKELKDQNWKVSGSDISKIAKENTEKIVGESIVKVGDFSKLKFKERFDYVSFWHVLEHVENPQDYFTKAESILTEGGKVVGEVPNFDSLALRIFKSNYSWLAIPVHITYFSKESLVYLAKKDGFRKISFYYPSRALLNFALSIDKYCQKKHFPFFLRMGTLVLSSPASILFVFISSLFGRGEVVRFVAEK